MVNKDKNENKLFWETVVIPAVLKRDKHKCVKCGSTKGLCVHHKKYGEDITINDLQTLCKKCHQLEHLGKGKNG